MGAPTRIGAGLSVLDDAAEAAREAAAALGGAPCDLAFVFVSSHQLGAAGAAAAAARSELRAARVVGCVAGGVLGGRRELEDGPGVAVSGFPQLDAPSLVALLVDPFTFPGGPFLEGLNQEYPGLPVVGGLAAGGHRPGLQALLLDGEVHGGGAVGAVISGIEVRTVVSQGCLPIGNDLVITRGEGNVVYELAGRPALERLREQVDALDELGRRKALRGLLVGLVIDENRPDYARGDYLIRGLLGGDEESGALVVGEAVRQGQTLRFHIRDGASARTDLREALATALEGTRPAGALVFTCSGRGISMFGEADHDAALVTDTLGGGGVAGFFCGGEIGPVGGRAFMHGFTATLAVILDGAAAPQAPA